MKKLNYLFITTILILVSISSIDCNKRNTDPTCSIIYPSNNQLLAKNKELTIKVEASDSDGTIKEVRLIIDGEGITTLSTFPYNYEWMPTIKGYHTIEAISLDHDGGTKSDVITISVEDGIIAGFKADTLSGEAPFLVQFTDTTNFTPYYWGWNFGDGTVSNEQNPSHTYNIIGAHTVKLTVRNENGEAVISKVNYIDVKHGGGSGSSFYFEILTDYMVSQNLDLPALMDGWVIDPKLIADGGIVDPTDYSIPDWVVFDIRKAEDFALGHIKGSVNVTLANIVSEAQAINNNDAKILVVCYSGQTAGRAVMALRLSGFPNAKVSKFGFSGWTANSAFDKWSSKISDQAVGNANWVSTASPALPVNALPTWTTTSTDGATILAEKINEMLTNTSWSVGGANVLATPADFSIYNFWTTEEYTTFGHFAGAFQYKPISLAGDIVSALNAENNNLVYCFTGQTSSFIVAWLNVLGYNAKIIGYGVNGLSYTALHDAGKPYWYFPYHTYTFETTKE